MHYINILCRVSNSLITLTATLFRVAFHLKCVCVFLFYRYLRRTANLLSCWVLRGTRKLIKFYETGASSPVWASIIIITLICSCSTRLLIKAIGTFGQLQFHFHICEKFAQKPIIACGNECECKYTRYVWGKWGEEGNGGGRAIVDCLAV